MLFCPYAVKGHFSLDIDHMLQYVIDSKSAYLFSMFAGIRLWDPLVSIKAKYVHIILYACFMHQVINMYVRRFVKCNPFIYYTSQC